MLAVEGEKGEGRGLDDRYIWIWGRSSETKLPGDRQGSGRQTAGGCFGGQGWLVGIVRTCEGVIGCFAADVAHLAGR